MFNVNAFLILACLCSAGVAQELLKVSVFYESLCPDSIYFITKRLAPAYPTLKDHIKLEFVPYGKAIHNLVDGQWQFSCQHGPDECYGNKMQACALNQNATQEINVNFVACVMGQSNPSSDSSMSSCAQNSGTISWDDMVSCRDDGTADQLLAAHGDKTHALEPNIAFVPTIVYNDVFSQTNQDNAWQDFLYTTCTLLGESKPSSCPTLRRTSRRYYF